MSNRIVLYAGFFVVVWITGEYALKFVPEIKKTGARPVLLMAWAYKRLGWISMAEIAQQHREAGKELSVDVAPVGLAWERAAKQRPDIHLFNADQETPTIPQTLIMCHEESLRRRAVS